MGAEDPKRTLRDELHAGGTSLGDGGFPWLLVGVGGAAALAAVVWWMAASGDDGRPPPVVTPAEPVASSPSPAGAGAVAPPPPPSPPRVDPLAARREAASALQRALGGDQLWSTVDLVGNGTAVVVQTAF